MLQVSDLTWMNQMDRYLDVQGQDSKTDAAQSHSCRMTEEKSRGQQRRTKTRRVSITKTTGCHSDCC